MGFRPHPPQLVNHWVRYWESNPRYDIGDTEKFTIASVRTEGGTVRTTDGSVRTEDGRTYDDGRATTTGMSSTFPRDVARNTTLPRDGGDDRKSFPRKSSRNQREDLRGEDLISVPEEFLRSVLG